MLPVLNELSEEEESDQRENTSIHTDSEGDEMSDSQEQSLNKKVVGSLDPEKQLNDIIRNSYVNFQRPSQGSSQILQMIKSPDIEKKGLQ